MIQKSRGNVFTAVNATVVALYWRIGEYISRKLEAATWGEAVVDKLAHYIQRRQPNLRGFTRRNLFRMRQFYDAYRGHKKVSALLTQLPWTHHLIILGQSKRPEEREFYLRLAVRERWSSRELERQLRAAAFERTVLAPAKVSRDGGTNAPRAPATSSGLLHRRVPRPARRALRGGSAPRRCCASCGDFLIELGRDFCFVGSEYPIQVGKRDFAIDLLFFHRGLNCLCAIELKVGQFEPEHLGQARTSTSRRSTATCASRTRTRRSASCSARARTTRWSNTRSADRCLPALVAEYQTQLPDKKLLQAKLHELYALAGAV